MQDDDASAERRRAERVPVNAEFGTTSVQMYVSDLSARGVFVQTDQALAVGTTVTVRFTALVDDPVVIEARGRVVRHHASPAGLGIEFTVVTPEMLLRIGDIVSRQRPLDLGEPLLRNLMPPGGAGDDDETRQTLLNLRAVDVEILDEDDVELDEELTRGRGMP